MKRQPATANKSEVSNILAVAPSTLTNYVREVGFPGEQNGEFEVRAAVIWWLLWKAPKALQQEANKSLSQALGLDIVEESSLPKTSREKRDDLDLILKEAQVGTQLKRLIDVADARELLETFSADLSSALSQVEQTTGTPVAGLIREPFERFRESLDAYQRGRPV